MPTSEAPAEVNEPKGPAEPSPQRAVPRRIRLPRNRFPAEIRPDPGHGLGSVLELDPRPGLEFRASPRSEPSPELGAARAPSPLVRGSRWIDYNTHELLEMISELEDERRWARLREGTLWAILVHIMLLFALYLIPRYIFKVPNVIDFDAIKEHQDLTYLDSRRCSQARPSRSTPLPQHAADRQTDDGGDEEARCAAASAARSSNRSRSSPSRKPAAHSAQSAVAG